MRSWILTLSVSSAMLGAAFIAPTPFTSPLSAQASHPDNPPWTWAKYSYNTPPDLRLVQWKPCGLTGSQKVLASGGIGNWPLQFGHSTKHQMLADSCSHTKDLIVRAVASNQVAGYCGATVAACLRLDAYNMNTCL